MKERSQNYLVINGKTYDARSGLEVREVAPAVKSLAKKSQRSMSDIAPAPKPAAQTPATTPHSPAVIPAQPVSSEPHPQVIAHKIHRKPQRAQTLLRNSVKRPQQSQDVVAAKTTPAIQPRVDHSQARRARAEQIQRQANVRRFAAQDVAPRQTQATPQEEVKPAIALAQLQSQHPALQRQPQASPEPEAKGSELKEKLIAERLAEAKAGPRGTKLAKEESRVNAFFSKQPRLLTAAVSALSVLLLVGYVTYLNMPTISMRIAANRAGFAATMPGYKPSGYSLHGPVAYSPGQVNVAYHSNTNNNSFTLSQRQSNWDTQALLDNYVAKQTNDYLTYQEKGLTIYMYDGKASWVNGGVWYSVHGDAILSSDQILQLATSM
jgi:hypothetical protein